MAVIVLYCIVRVHFSEGDQEIHVDSGGDVTLECSAEGYPLNVVWKKLVKGKETDIGKYFFLFFAVV